jgi:hypothetical protein
MRRLVNDESALRARQPTGNETPLMDSRRFYRVTTSAEPDTWLRVLISFTFSDLRINELSTLGIESGE